MRRLRSETDLRLSTDEPVNIGGDIRRGGLVCADRPDRLVGDYEFCELHLR
jgi:hypothetical protein